MADFDQYSTAVDASGDSKESHLDSKPEFSEDEKSLITRMYKLVGKRWSLIAGRIPGRTAVEIEKYWTSTHSNNQ